MNRTVKQALLATSLLATSSLASAWACTAISSLPTTIYTSGKYCLDSNLSHTANTPGITINASDVELNLMGYTIKGMHADGTIIESIATMHVGVKINSRTENVRIRNGAINGFYTGISGQDAPGIKDIVIEELLINNTPSMAIATGESGSVVVRNNIIRIDGRLNTNAATSGSAKVAIYMSCSNSSLGTPANVIENNKISEIYPSTTGTGSYSAIWGIYARDCHGTQILNNYINSTAWVPYTELPSTSVAISLYRGHAHHVEGNTIRNYPKPISEVSFQPPTSSIARNNTIQSSGPCCGMYINDGGGNVQF